MLGLGTPELLIILFIVLLLFGGRKLPELARSLGSAVREYSKASGGSYDEEEKPAQKQEDEERGAIIEAAKRMGINTEGKSLTEIAKEIAKATEKKV